MSFKKLLKVSLLTSSLALSLLSNVQADDDIALGIPGYAGSGCPAGSASVTLSPDAKSLSILFDSFVAEAGKSVKKTLDRKSCNLAIPVHVPHGISISIIDVDYRGFVSLPDYTGSAQLTAEYFFAGLRGPKYTKSWSGPLDTDYTFTNTLGVIAQVWSPCGADTNIRVNASMTLKNSLQRDALASVDSIDMAAGLVYKLAWRYCTL